MHIFRPWWWHKVPTINSEPRTTMQKKVQVKNVKKSKKENNKKENNFKDSVKSKCTSSDHDEDTCKISEGFV